MVNPNTINHNWISEFTDYYFVPISGDFACRKLDFMEDYMYYNTIDVDEPTGRRNWMKSKLLSFYAQSGLSKHHLEPAWLRG